MFSGQTMQAKESLVDQSVQTEGGYLQLGHTFSLQLLL